MQVVGRYSQSVKDPRSRVRVPLGSVFRAPYPPVRSLAEQILAAILPFEYENKITEGLIWLVVDPTKFRETGRTRLRNNLLGLYSVLMYGIFFFFSQGACFSNM